MESGPNLIIFRHLGHIWERKASEEDFRAGEKENIVALWSIHQQVSCEEQLQRFARWTYLELGNADTRVWEVITNRHDGSR